MRLMLVRVPMALVLLLAATVVAATLSADPAGLLLLTPALALVLPLLFGLYLGESSVARLASWFARALSPEVARPASQTVGVGFSFCLSTGFSGACAGRGPPAFR
jgi:hypothetical protein